MGSKTKQKSGISPVGKLMILCVVFGIPLAFALTSMGLKKLFDYAPILLLGVEVIAATIYTAYTSKLLYQFYDINPTPLRFVPFLGDVTLIDVKWQMPCYILYAVSIVFFLLSQLPYSIIGVLGDTFATKAPFFIMLVSFAALAAVQVIKGVGLMGCAKDLNEDWKRIIGTEVGIIKRLSLLSFIPFVRVLAIYGLNKPLSTMVEYNGMTADSGAEEVAYEEED